MKNIIILFLIISIKSSSQGILFKYTYKPNLKYEQTTKQTSKNEVTYIGPDDLLKRLGEKNIKNPSIQETETIIKNTNTTGKILGNSFPITIRFNGEKSIIPDGTILYGKVPVGQTPILDSIIAPEMDKQNKEDFLLAMQKTISQISIPERTVKLGETFKREIPLKIPIGKYTFDLTNTVTYTLKKIEKNLAYFDIVQSYSINTSKNMGLTANGTGTGRIIYDIDNTFYLLYELTSNINMEVKNDDISMRIISNSETNMSANISKNE